MILEGINSAEVNNAIKVMAVSKINKCVYNICIGIVFSIICKLLQLYAKLFHEYL